MKGIPSHNGPVLVIGSTGLDIIGKSTGPLIKGTSNPGTFRMAPGGVARNVAENLARLGMEAILITAVGDDAEGRSLLEQAADAGINIEHALTIPDQMTGAYLAVLDDRGNLYHGIDDMRVVNSISSAHLRGCKQLFKQASAIFIDANLPKKTLQTAIILANRAGVPIAADPTSASLAPNLKPHLESLWLITTNETEAEALCPESVPHAHPQKAIAAAKYLTSCGVDIAIVTMAEFGLGYATAYQSGHVPAIYTEITDPTGAGDALTACVIFALLNDIPLDEAVRLGVSSAALTLNTVGNVVPNLSLELLYDQLH